MSTDNFVKGECRHCAGHLEFPARAAGETIECPHCGQPTKLVAAKKGVRNLLVGVAVAIVLAIGSLGVLFLAQKHPSPVSSPKIDKAIPPAKPAPPRDEFVTNEFSIAAIKLEKAAGGSLVYVTGNVRNLAARQRFGVKLEFSLFDSNNVPAGKATDYNRSFEPNGVWNFKALVLDSKAAVARLASIGEAP